MGVVVMENLVEKMDTPDNFGLLKEEVLDLYNRLDRPPQITLTTINGNKDDWYSGNGYHSNPERFCKINESLKGSYIESLINKYTDYGRWRIMALEPKTTLTVHKDGWGSVNNRIHVPIISNPNSWLVFYEHELVRGSQRVEHFNLKPGIIYRCNTTNYHTAVNYDHNETRIHIIGEKNVR